jgi:SAM-dependent methyltransferase
MNTLESGAYARKQIHCPSRVVAWSHGSRFALARRLADAAGGGRLLDYGCGDATFIAMVHDRFAEVVGVDVDPRQLADCARRLRSLANVRFALAGDVASSGWDVVTCMEVLEHCVEEERRRVLGVLRGLVAPDGRVIISVPLEIGPTLIGKQLFRALAGWRRLGDYAHRERYTLGELARSAAGRPVPRVAYEGRGADGPYRYYGHKGFDWRDLERELGAHFVVERRRFTPMPWCGAVLNSQVWFVCRPRPS